MSEMQFTGERLVPGGPGTEQIYHEHLLRYLFAQQFIKGKRVLDAACGAGYGSAILAKGGALSVTGVDISAEAIEYSRTHYQAPNLNFEVMDCCHMTFPDSTFDVVVSFEAIEHIQDAKNFLREIRRVIKDTGLLVVSTPNSATFTENPFHVREYSRSEFVELLKSYFPNIGLYEEDYLLFLAVRGKLSEFFIKKEHEIVASENLRECEPDYFIALCACQEQFEMPEAKDFLYELPAEIINQKNFRIAELQQQVEERTCQALGLEKQVKEMEKRLEEIYSKKAYRVYRFVRNLVRRSK